MKKSKNKREKEESYYRVERSYGYFRRAIELPAEVDSKKVDASYKKGILKMKIRKAKAFKNKNDKSNHGLKRYLQTCFSGEIWRTKMLRECCPECGHLLSKNRSICPFCGWDEDEDPYGNACKIEHDLSYLDSSAGRQNHLHAYQDLYTRLMLYNPC